MLTYHLGLVSDPVLDQVFLYRLHIPCPKFPVYGTPYHYKRIRVLRSDTREGCLYTVSDGCWDSGTLRKIDVARCQWGETER